jgi:hypothetical protein
MRMRDIEVPAPYLVTCKENYLIIPFCMINRRGGVLTTHHHAAPGL